MEWDLSNGPLSKLRSSHSILRFFRGPWSVGPVGDFLDYYIGVNLQHDITFLYFPSGNGTQRFVSHNFLNTETEWMATGHPQNCRIYVNHFVWGSSMTSSL